MYSMIKKVDNHMKKDNIDIDKVAVKAVMFPKYINKAFLYEVRSFHDMFFDNFSNEVSFLRDNNGALYMLIQDLRKQKNVVILDDTRTYIDVPFRINRVVFEQDLIRNASMLRYLEKWSKKMGDTLCIPQEIFKDMDPREAIRQRHIMEYEILKKKIEELNKAFTKQGISIYDKVPCDVNALHRTTCHIMSYIDYLNWYYRENIKETNCKERVKGGKK